MKKSLFGLTLALAGVMGTLPVETQAWWGIPACSEATPDLTQDSLLIAGNFKYCKNPSAWLGQEDGSYTKLVATVVDNNTVEATLIDSAVMEGSTQNVVVYCGWIARCEIDVAFGGECEDCSGAPVAKTGQTQCTYQPDGWEWDSDCTQETRPGGQDGEIQAGVAWPDPRFTDNGDGTVTDNLTGLIWLKNANCFEYLAWTAALDAANKLNDGECDLTDGSAEGDWRLPNIKELQSLVHYGVYAPTLPNTAGTGKWTENDPFSGVQSRIYWSSTSYAGDASGAWDLGLYNGYVGGTVKTNTSYVWPVRGGQ